MIDEAEADELGQALRGETDRQPVEHDPEAARDLCFRDRAAELRGGRPLRRRDTGEVSVGGGRANVEALCGRRARKRARCERGGERRQLQRHDHANAAARVTGGDLHRAGAKARQGRLAEPALDGP
jgi:hypothetical protein